MLHCVLNSLFQNDLIMYAVLNNPYCTPPNSLYSALHLFFAQPPSVHLDVHSLFHAVLIYVSCWTSHHSILYTVLYISYSITIPFWMLCCTFPIPYYFIMYAVLHIPYFPLPYSVRCVVHHPFLYAVPIFGLGLLWMCIFFYSYLTLLWIHKLWHLTVCIVLQRITAFVHIWWS